MKTAWQKWTACLLATLMVLGTVFAGPGVYAWAADLGAVSYTHLTLPTTERV